MHQPKPHLSHVDVVEVHDFCTGNELISYEDHGFAERRGGYKLVEVDVTTIGRWYQGLPRDKRIRVPVDVPEIVVPVAGAGATHTIAVFHETGWQEGVR